MLFINRFNLPENLIGVVNSNLPNCKKLHKY